MLEDYFSIVLESESENKLVLKGLPIILQGHSPSPHALPMFLLRLATQVRWEEEQTCFEGVCTELAFYYAESMPTPGATVSFDVDDTIKKHVQHVLFPAFRYYLMPPKEFASDGSFSKLALLSKLYKVFERC
jgi:DNA mismatch repair protein MLH1